MMKKRITYIKGFIVTLFLAVILTGGPILYRGYQLYQSVTKERSLEEVVNELRDAPNYLMLDKLSPSYLEEVVMSEDKRFYAHGAIDPISIARAACIDLKERRFAEGGSTITQQLAKNLYFSGEKSLERKVAEVFVACDLESHYTKDEILEMYCNITYFGEGCYGLGEACAHYYGVTPLELSKAQVQALVFTIKAPNCYNPHAYAEIE